MKAVEFSLGNAPAAKPKIKRPFDTEVDDGVKAEQITEFSAAASTAPAKKERKVIACKPNRVPSKMQADTEAIGNLEDKFEASAQAQTVGSGTYGLMARDNAKRDEHTREVREVEVLKKQTDDLPNEPDGRAYEDMPVEEFGLALLRGMGMTKEHVVPTVDFIARPSRMGLGAKPGEIVTGKKQNYKQLVGIDGSIKSVVRKGEKVIDVASLGPKVGKRMTVAGGRHEGLECEVKALSVNGDSDAVRVRLFPSERDVTVSASVLTEPGAPARPSARVPRDAAHPRSDPRDAGGRGERGSAAGSGAGDRHKSARHEGDGQGGGGSGRDGAGSSRSKTHRGHIEDSRRTASQGGTAAWTGAPSGGRKSWLREGIRVRVVSKHVGRGKVYLAKAWLTAVVTVGECHIMLNDGSVVEGVREKDLETVVSKKEGTRIIVVLGKHAGEHGKVLEKSKQSVMVQLSESRDVVELDLDSVADYQGSEHDDDW